MRQLLNNLITQLLLYSRAYRVGRHGEIYETVGIGVSE